MVLSMSTPGLFQDLDIDMLSYDSFSFLALPETGHQETFRGISLEDPMILVLALKGKDTPE